MKTPRQFLLRLCCLVTLVLCNGYTPRADDANFVLEQQQVEWEQVDGKQSLIVFSEREQYDSLDRFGRFICAVQIGKPGPALRELSLDWQISSANTTIGKRSASIAQGLLAVSFDLRSLQPGEYRIIAELRQGEKILQTASDFFRCKTVPTPPATGRIALNLPRGVPLTAGSFPLNCGVPFPKGVLWDNRHVRVVTASGQPVPVQTMVRSRWGHRPQSSIRWLGIDFQAASAPPWWPQRKDSRYFLEYGPQVSPAPAASPLRVSESETGIDVHTGPLRFTVRRRGFNLLADVKLNGKSVLSNGAGNGPYLVDHEGATYRGANDMASRVTVEEQGPLRVVLRAEGWYVKDGTMGEKQSYTLPTERLCKFVTRIEAYAGKPYVRVLHTWVNTFDTFSVRLRDVGISLPVTNATKADFGVEKSSPQPVTVGRDGVYLIQHLPHEFAVESGDGKLIKKGEHSAGWVAAQTSTGIVSIGHRETWQRFPKELEVLPGALKLHIWPAHGRTHPDIDETARDQIHKLWFAHQGREMDLAMPWSYYLQTAKYTDSADKGIYTAPGIALMGVHSSAMGTAVTSDFLIHFSEPNEAAQTKSVNECFQAAPSALPDTKWLCDSLATGYLHPYDPDNFADLESVIQKTMRGYWKLQDDTGEYGMWLYRTWHHTSYKGENAWNLYRLYNATHHYEAFMPWMLYARSGDPFYLTQGMANIRLLSDAQILHYNDPAYPHREFYSRQERAVGSTKHTNGFSTWGGDHGPMGHLTCYNGLILAYYLTGDLRLREVVVDEWQQTIVADRKNPQVRNADRSLPGQGGGRDANNALGELIDAYQLTYHPGLLARMEPLVRNYSRDMWHWGQVLHNLLRFRGSTEIEKILLDGAREYQATGGKPSNPHRFWTTDAPHENLALAAIHEPGKGYEKLAYEAAKPIQRQLWAEDITQKRHAALSQVPDYILYAPRVMRAMASVGSKGGKALPEGAQSLLVGGGSDKQPGFSRCIVREDVDAEFTVSIFGIAGNKGVPVQIFGPDDDLVLKTAVPTGLAVPFEIKVPKDGKTGQYVIFILAREAGEPHDLYLPLTTLPGEVYALTQGAQWMHVNPVRYFTRSANEDEDVEIQPHAAEATITENGSEKILAKTVKGEIIRTKVSSRGAWINLNARYGRTYRPLTLSLSPSLWFAPEASKLNLQPQAN